jgi:hypothetical protein
MAEVYALIRESDDTIRYIGWTSFTAQKRFREHKDNKRRKVHTPVYDWMNKYDDVIYKVLHSGLTNERAMQLEIDLIAEIGLKNLLNIQPGGEGNKSARHREEFKRKMSERLKGIPLSEEHKRKISEANKGRKRGPVSEEQKARLIALSTGRMVSEETRKKMSTKMKGRTFSEETKARMSAAQKKRFENQEQRRKVSESLTGKKLSEKHRKKISDGLNKFYGNIEAEGE